MQSSAELKQQDNQFIHPWDDIVKIGSHQRTLLDRGRRRLRYRQRRQSVARCAGRYVVRQYRSRP